MLFCKENGDRSIFSKICPHFFYVPIFSILCPDTSASGLNLTRQGLSTLITNDWILRMKPTLSLLRHTKNIIALTTLSLFLSGCIGVSVSMPEGQSSQTSLTDEESDSDTTREWCGVTLWALIVPIPLKLPVCKLHKGQSISSPFYACGPLMILGPISHGYEGNALCGMFPK